MYSDENEDGQPSMPTPEFTIQMVKLLGINVDDIKSAVIEGVKASILKSIEKDVREKVAESINETLNATVSEWVSCGVWVSCGERNKAPKKAAEASRYRRGPNSAANGEPRSFGFHAASVGSGTGRGSRFHLISRLM